MASLDHAPLVGSTRRAGAAGLHPATALAEARIVTTVPSFSLAQTCGPVAWGRGRWPNVDWADGDLVWMGWEQRRLVWRRVRQGRPGELVIDGPADAGLDASWAAAALGCDRA